MKKRTAIDPRSEFGVAELGDRRLNTRLDRMVAALEDAPERSFPSAMRSEAELEGAYRFFKNPKVNLGRLLDPHVEATVQRARAAEGVLVLHDTTELRYGGSVRGAGLGDLANQGQGFLGHFAWRFPAMAVESLWGWQVLSRSSAKSAPRVSPRSTTASATFIGASRFVGGR